MTPNQLAKLVTQLKAGTLRLSPTDFTPYYQFERWHKAKYNAAAIRFIRKEGVLCGIDPTTWGCPPHEYPPPALDIAPKGKVYERLRPFRKEYVSKLMQEMPSRIAKWREELKMKKLEKQPKTPF